MRILRVDWHHFPHYLNSSKVFCAPNICHLCSMPTCLSSPRCTRRTYGRRVWSSSPSVRYSTPWATSTEISSWFPSTPPLRDILESEFKLNYVQYIYIAYKTGWVCYRYFVELMYSLSIHIHAYTHTHTHARTHVYVQVWHTRWLHGDDWI